MTATDSYRQLLTVFFKLLPANDIYWQLLTVTDSYWQLPTNTEKYWQLLTETASYWQLLTDITIYCQLLTAYNSWWLTWSAFLMSCMYSLHGSSSSTATACNWQIQQQDGIQIINHTFNQLCDLLALLKPLLVCKIFSSSHLGERAF